jgi:hypothetical protein
MAHYLEINGDEFEGDITLQTIIEAIDTAAASDEEYQMMMEYDEDIDNPDYFMNLDLRMVKKIDSSITYCLQTQKEKEDRQDDEYACDVFEYETDDTNFVKEIFFSFFTNNSIPNISKWKKHHR